MNKSEKLRYEALRQAALVLRAALSDCVNFIENIGDDNPDRDDIFFKLRGAWRNAYGVADEVDITCYEADRTRNDHAYETWKATRGVQ